MKKFALAIIFLALLLIAGLVYLLRPQLEFEELLITEPPCEYVTVYGKHTVGQVFVPNFEGLSKLGFFIFKDAILPDSNLVLHIKPGINVKDDICKVVVAPQDIHGRRYPFMAPQIKSGKGSVYFFELDTFQSRPGKPVYFYLESPAATQERAYKIGVVNNIFRRGYAGGATYIDAAPIDKHLLFQDYYKFTKPKERILATIKERVSLDKGFFSFYLSLVAFIIAIIIILAVMERFYKR